MTAPAIQGTATELGIGGTASANLAIPKPTGLADGEKLVAVIHTKSAHTITAVPTGWSLVVSNTATGATKIYIYEKDIVTAAGEPSTYTWTISASATNWGGSMVRVAGGGTWDTGGAATFVEASDASVEFPTITTPVVDCLVFYVGGFDNGRTAATPTGCTQIFDSEESGAVKPSNAHAWFVESYASATATTARTSALSGAANDTLITVALRPGGTSVTPAASVLTATASFPAIGVASLHGAAVLTALATFPTVGIGMKPQPSVLTAVATFPSPTVSTISGPILSTPLTAVATFPGAGIGIAQVVSVLTAVASFPAVVIKITATPPVLTAVATFPGAQFAGLELAAILTATVSFPGATVSTALLVPGPTLLATVSFPGATFNLGTQPGALLALVSFPTVTLLRGAGPTPATLLAVVSFPQPVIAVPIPPNSFADMTITVNHVALQLVSVEDMAGMTVSERHVAEVISSDF